MNRDIYSVPLFYFVFNPLMLSKNLTVKLVVEMKAKQCSQQILRTYSPLYFMCSTTQGQRVLKVHENNLVV